MIHFDSYHKTLQLPLWYFLLRLLVSGIFGGPFHQAKTVSSSFTVLFSELSSNANPRIPSDLEGPGALPSGAFLKCVLFSWPGIIPLQIVSGKVGKNLIQG